VVFSPPVESRSESHCTFLPKHVSCVFSPLPARLFTSKALHLGATFICLLVPLSTMRISPDLASLPPQMGHLCRCGIILDPPFLPQRPGTPRFAFSSLGCFFCTYLGFVRVFFIARRLRFFAVPLFHLLPQMVWVLLPLHPPFSDDLANRRCRLSSFPRSLYMQPVFLTIPFLAPKAGLQINSLPPC